MNAMILLELAMPFFVGASPQAKPAADYPITPVPFNAVHVEGGFWAPRFETNRKVTVGYDFAKCEETGRIDNFAIAGKLKPGAFRGIPYDDSDVYKVVEGASYTLATHPDPKLDQYLDDLIAKIAAAQEPDGYLCTARSIPTEKPHPRARGPRWLNEMGDIAPGADSHELYNIGHMYEAAVAHYRATGKRTLLDVAIKSADLVARTWGPGPDQLKIPSGHQEIEIGLVKLYRVTGERKYLDLAKFLLEQRGRGGKTYYQDHEPVLEQAEAVGHAVRACYMYSAMADVAALTGDPAYLRAIDRLWEDVVGHKLAITGGVGARKDGEAFGDAYELPNAEAYNETCAAIANALWNHRMFLLHGDAKYMDVFERIIYNGFLSGVALSGDRFFYANPLAADTHTAFNYGELRRAPWFSCSCCPVNIVRFIPSLAGCVYAARGADVYVNLFISGRGKVETTVGPVEITQQTDYPWHGQVTLRIDPGQPRRFALRVRVPGWAQGHPVPSDLYRYLDADSVPPVNLSVNGQAVELHLEQGFAVIEREWAAGDSVRLELPMPVRRVLANDKVASDRGLVAVERGPVVYCAEAVDNGPAIAELRLPDDTMLKPEHRAELLGGVTILNGNATMTAGGGNQAAPNTPSRLTLIPYYAWAHRDLGAMAVWLNR